MVHKLRQQLPAQEWRCSWLLGFIGFRETVACLPSELRNKRGPVSESRRFQGGGVYPQRRNICTALLEGSRLALSIEGDLIDARGSSRLVTGSHITGQHRGLCQSLHDSTDRLSGADHVRHPARYCSI